MAAEPPAAGEAAGERVARAVMADVARSAGVSMQTVSRVLNGSDAVRPATRERVEAAVRALGYQRNQAARVLATRRSGTVGVLIMGELHFGLSSTFMAVEVACREAGYYVSVASIRSPDTRAIGDALAHLTGQQVEGVIAITQLPATAEVLVAEGVGPPVVLIMAGAQVRAGISTVAVDQRAGAQLAARHLHGTGRRRLLHVTGLLSWVDGSERLAGYEEACAELGLEAAWVDGRGWDAENGYEVGRRLLAEPLPEGIFLGNDQLSLGALRAFHEAGVRVPDDVAIVGFDDAPGAAAYSPPLTTIRQDFAELGRSSVALLDDMLAGAGERAITVEPVLVPRRSSASVPPVPARSLP